MKELQFSLTEHDHRNFTYILLSRYQKGGTVQLIASTGIGIALSTVLINLLKTSEYYTVNTHIQTALTLVIFWIIYFLAQYFFKTFGKKPQLDPQGVLLAQHKLKIDTRGIAFETNYNKSFTRWQGILDIQETDDYVLFYTDRTIAHQLPKTVFEKPEHTREFLEKVRHYWKNPNSNKKGSFELVYSLSEHDFDSLCHIIGKQYKKRNIIQIIIVALVGAALSVWFIEGLRAEGNLPTRDFLQTGLAVVIYYTIYFFTRGLYQSLAEYDLLDPQGSFLAPQTLTIDAKGVVEKSTHDQYFTDWRGIIDIQETIDYLLLYNGQITAYLVPKTAFETPEDAAAFLEQARDYRQKSGRGAKNEKGKSDDTAEKS
ncbi:MAG: YcxB family protein [Micavibrio sp.]|nr:MAG: YcxB family protein [Micavibrio sp.]